MLKEILSVVFLCSIVAFTACKKSTDIPPDNGNSNNNNNNNNGGSGNNQTNLPPGWYTDTASFHVTGTFATLIALQSDGKIIGANPTEVGRLNKDGSPDQSFTPYKIATGEIHALCVGNDDKIYIGGNFKQFSGSSYSYLVRLNKDGSVDNTFTALNYLSQGDDIKCLTLRSDGKLMVGGKFNFATEILSGGIASIYFDNIMRLNADGSVDNSFFNIETQNSNYFTSEYVTSIDILSDNRVYVTGDQLYARAQGGISSVYDVVRINEDGTLDRTFMKDGAFWLLGTSDLIVKHLSDGSILLAGAFNKLDNKTVSDLLHISESGHVIDPGFSGVLNVPTGFCQFSNDEILVTEKNPPTVYFGTPAPRLWLKGLDGKDLGTMKDDILGGDMYSIIKESDSTALIAGKMQAKKANAPSVTVAFARIKKHL